MDWNLFRRPVLFSLLLTLLGGFIMAHGLAVDNAGASRGGLAVLVSLAPLPLLWGTALASPWVGQDGTRTAASSPRFGALLAGALAAHAVSSCWLWWWAGEPFFGSFFAVIGGLFALQYLLVAVIGWRSPRAQGQKGAGLGLSQTGPNQAPRQAGHAADGCPSSTAPPA